MTNLASAIAFNLCICFSTKLAFTIALLFANVYLCLKSYCMSPDITLYHYPCGMSIPPPQLFILAGAKRFELLISILEIDVLPITTIPLWSKRWESNPRHRLQRPSCYYYTNPLNKELIEYFKKLFYRVAPYIYYYHYIQQQCE